MTGYDTIRVLGDIEAVQQNPSLHIGPTDHPTHLAMEVIDNSIDEAIAGHTKLISVFYNKAKSSLTVLDHGRGFPDIASTGEDAVVVAATKLNSGGKFGDGGYSTSAGLHGIGLVAVNALSSSLIITTMRKAKSRTYFFENGIFKICTAVPTVHSDHTISEHGSLVEFIPNAKFFESIVIRESVIVDKLKLAASLLPNVIFKYQEKVISKYSDEELIGGKSSIPIQHITSGVVDGEEINLVLGYTEETELPTYRGSVNLLQVDRGTHVNEVLYAIYDAWEPLIKGTILERTDVHCGLRIFVNAKLKKPAYTSQTKECLSIRKDSISKLKASIRHSLANWIMTSGFKDKLLTRFIEYRKALNMLSSNKLLETVIEYGEVSDGVVERRGSGASKLFDCNSKSRDGTELFVVEGDSAAGGLIPTRDKTKHAILPLRGKILNVIDQPIEDIVKNTEIRSLVNAIGSGAFFKQNHEKCRYEKIILMTDADPDGQNILALLIGCLCYVCEDVVEAGFIYVCKPPLYGQYDGRKTFRPVYDRKDIDSRWGFKRFKGLGEMNPHELAKVSFDPNFRQLVQVILNKSLIKEVFKIIGTSQGKREILETAGLIVRP